jgi:hypothetical protein
MQSINSLYSQNLWPTSFIALPTQAQPKRPATTARRPKAAWRFTPRNDYWTRQEP